MIDNIDRKILSIVQANGRITNAEIARQIEMAPSAVLERMRRLEERGVIKDYTAVLDSKKLELGLLAFVFIRADEREDVLTEADLTAEELAALPGVLEVHHIAGEDCFMLKLRAQDTEDLYRVMKEDFGKIKSIRSSRTCIVLKTVKETSRLPIEITH